MSNDLCYNCFREKPEDTAGSSCPYCGYDPNTDLHKYPLALPGGTILAGRYILGRVLGQGGFGITYVAQDWQTKSLVAVKEYLPDTMATRTGGASVSPYSGEREESFRYGKECFLQEAQTLAEFIGNPNIVRIHSYFEENGTAYFVMDYVAGISFQKYIENNGGKISWEDAERILLPVMTALGAVHSRGIIHRDVTPDNIYITADGTVKLLDFGAARYSLGNQSRSLDVVLKHGFAPKEQYTRKGRQSSYTDVYSLAATFYYAVTGRTPPDSVDRVDEDDLFSPSSLGIKIPKQVEDAILKGMSVQAADRFQTMDDFRAALTGKSGQDTEDSADHIRSDDPGKDISETLKESIEEKSIGGKEISTNDGWNDRKSGSRKWLRPVALGAVGVLVLAIVLAVVPRGKKEAAYQGDTTRTTAAAAGSDGRRLTGGQGNGAAVSGGSQSGTATETVTGNTSGNLSNGGYLCSQGSAVYMWLPGSGMIHVLANGGGDAEVYKEGDISAVSMVNDMLYFLDADHQVCRMNRDGSQEEVLLTGSDTGDIWNLIMSEKAAYIVCIGSSGTHIYRSELDVSGRLGDTREITDNCYNINSVVLDDGWLYYPDRTTYGKDICRIPADGSEEPEVLCSFDGVCASLVEEGGYLYAAVSPNNIYRIDPQDGSEELLAAQVGGDGSSVSTLNVYRGNELCAVSYPPADDRTNCLVRISSGVQKVIYQAAASESLSDINLADTDPNAIKVMALIDNGVGTRILLTDMNGSDASVYGAASSGIEGNIQANLVNGSFAVEDEDSYYYAIRSGIVKVDKSSGNAVILTGRDAEYLNVYGDSLYYLSNGDLWGIGKDGRDEACLLEGQKYESMIIVDGYCYVYNGDPGCLTRIPLNSNSSANVVADDMLGEEKYLILDDYVYYCDDADMDVYRVHTDGSGREFLCKDLGHWPNFYDDWIYWSDLTGGIWRMRLDGSRVETSWTITGGVSCCWNLAIYKDTFYFMDTDDSIYRMNMDGSGLRKIADPNELGCTYIYDINFVDEWMLVDAYSSVIAINLNDGRKVVNPGLENGEVTPIEPVSQAQNDNSEYILPESDSRYYTAAELRGYSADELRLARNEIYARYGCTFKSADLQAYFDSKSWYRKGTRAASSFSTTEFNPYERANIDMIKSVEAEK